MKKRNSIYFLFVFLFLISCKNEIPISENNNNVSKIELKKDFSKQIDSCKHFLQNGTIVLRTGNDAISNLFTQLNKTDKTFSHCGIAFEENKKWYVYHSIGGEDNPDEKLRKEPFENFVGASHNFGFGICEYKMNTAQQAKLKTIVSNWHQKETPFDMKFDLKTDDHLYCAEMVFKAFNKTFETDSFFTITNHKGFKYVSTDNIFMNKDAQMLCHLVY